MSYARVPQYKFVDGIDALNRAALEGWVYVNSEGRFISARFLVSKHLKKKVSA